MTDQELRERLEKWAKALDSWVKLPILIAEDIAREMRRAAAALKSREENEADEA